MSAIPQAPRASSRQGRPEATSHAAIERAAFALFAERGFEGTTLEDIARAVGVGRRTLFRYFESKNDIPWGQFDETLVHFHAILDDTPADMPLADAVAAGVAEFNRFPSDADPPHAARIRLILTTPALQAHSAVRYLSWRRVIADFVARRAGVSSDDPLPTLIGHVSLALALSAYDDWMQDSSRSLPDIIGAHYAALRGFLVRQS